MPGIFLTNRSRCLYNIQVIQFVTFLSPNVGGHDSPFKGVANHHPSKVTSRIARILLFYFTRLTRLCTFFWHGGYVDFLFSICIIYTLSNKQWGCIVRSEVPPVVNNHGQVSGINVDPAEAFEDGCQPGFVFSRLSYR